MELSTFLAKAFGLYLLIVSVALFINQTKMRAMIDNITKNDSLMFLSGVIALIIGIPLVILHNKWVMDWQFIITLIAWISLIKGSLRILFTDYCANMMRTFAVNRMAYYVLASLSLSLGVFLSYAGFFK